MTYRRMVSESLWNRGSGKHLRNDLSRRRSTGWWHFFGHRSLSWTWSTCWTCRRKSRKDKWCGLSCLRWGSLTRTGSWTLARDSTGTCRRSHRSQEHPQTSSNVGTVSRIRRTTQRS